MGSLLRWFLYKQIATSQKLTIENTRKEMMSQQNITKLGYITKLFADFNLKYVSHRSVEQCQKISILILGFLFPCLGLFLLLTRWQIKNKNGNRMLLVYQGSYGVMYVLCIVLSPIAFLMLFIKGVALMEVAENAPSKKTGQSQGDT
jgi:hypothetical protein